MDERFLRSLRLNREGVDFNDYPFNLSAVLNLEELDFDPKVTFLIGENGAGKSTLIEAIAVAFGLNAEGGTQNFNFQTKSSHSDLAKQLTLIKDFKRPRESFFLRAETFYNFASAVDTYEASTSYGDKSLHQQSHGESFLSLFGYRLGGDSLIIMDEPEAALSITKQMRFIAHLKGLNDEGSQLIIATHSPVILSYPGAKIYEVGSDGISIKDYEETDQYQLTKYFLSNYEAMIKEIIG